MGYVAQYVLTGCLTFHKSLIRKHEVTVDLGDGVTLVLRDDGEIFDITDADARVSSLRSYLVSNLMTAIPNRRNLTTTGFNRNVFKL